MEIDAAMFKKKTGVEPHDDDLDRANCSLAGNITHSMCGWCDLCDKPRFICFHALYPIAMGA